MAQRTGALAWLATQLHKPSVRLKTNNVQVLRDIQDAPYRSAVYDRMGFTMRPCTSVKR